MRLHVTEIFHSIQGESSLVGRPTVFIRLTGCPLRCQYCDTSYAFKGGQSMTVDETLDRVRVFSIPYVTVTGGEPLAQKSCLSLLTRLADEGYQVSLETSGAIDISVVDPRIKKIMDIKTPDSKMALHNQFQNLKFIKKTDEIKFVICSRSDYDWSKDILHQYKLWEYCEILFSPSYQILSPTQLAEWILADKLLVRLQVQLHKLLWGEQSGR